jgi:hypothetical protein
MFEGYRGFKSGKPIDDIDLPRIGDMLGVGEDEIHAVIDVETAGRWRDDQGRIRMLFEPHQFYKHLPDAKRGAAVAQGLAYPKWGAKPYPKDSYPRLLAAMQIDEEAALKSASWGGPQIMGSNFGMVGYTSPKHMVLDFLADDDNQLEAMVKFIKAAKLDDELRAHQWAAFARGYNGPGYAKNSYDTKLAAAYKWWQSKPDTPWKGEIAPGASKPPPLLPSAPVSPVAPPSGFWSRLWRTLFS